MSEEAGTKIQITRYYHPWYDKTLDSIVVSVDREHQYGIKLIVYPPSKKGYLHDLGVALKKLGRHIQREAGKE